MADISTAVSMARVPILGENGRISDDYIPAAIGENVTKAESAATRAETAATAAEGSASAASQSATQAAGSASAASASASRAQQSATTAGSAATSAQSAQTAAEAAKTAAEAAQSAAAGSAHDAQQSATAAQKSAASVADKFIASAQATTLEPGSQATASVENQVLTIGVPKGDKGDQGEKGDTGTGVPEGGEPGQLLSKTDSGTAWVDPPSGNVLKGTLGPAPILSADDAYATKPRRLTVYGETRQNLWANPSGTSNGVTVTSNGDGSMTLSGTATSAASISSADSYIIRPSTAYTLSMNAALTGASFVVTEYDAAGSQLAQHNVSSTSAASFTSSASVARCVMSLSVQSEQAVSGTYRVMLNEGSEAEPWCPPGLNSVGDDGDFKIVTAGKNLLNEDAPTADGVVGPQLPPGEYVLSGTLPSGASLRLLNGGADGETVTDTSSLPHTFSSGYPFTPYYAGVGGYATGLMLELGSTATAYEPPNITTIPIDLQGHTLNALPDGTRDELYIDGGGNVVLEKRTGSVTLSSDAGDWKKNGTTDFRYYMDISPAARNSYVPGSVASDALPYRVRTDDAYTGTHIIAAAYDAIATVGIDETAQDIADVCGGKKLLYTLATPQTIPLPAVTLPTLPAPTVNVYADAESSATGYMMGPDVGMEYERDVTIAFDKLQAQVSATTVREATNG